MQAINIFFILTGLFISATTPTGFDIEVNLIPGEQDTEIHVPGRFITSGPAFHWFGYYDKLEFDPSGRYVLGMQTDFENRSPEGNETIRIGMVDLENNDQWIELGTSQAWNWQQGCMLQFIPGSGSLVIWNDRAGDQFISRIMDIHSREVRTLPFPVYALSPDGNKALSLDFERINNLRKGYGYAGIPDPDKNDIAPDHGGIYLCDLISGTKKMIISIAEMQRMKTAGNEQALDDRFHQMNWFNHLLFNTDGSRFVFLHRWKSVSWKDVGGFGTLMYSAKPDGSDIRIVDGSGYTSHFIWKNPQQLLVWTKHSSHGFGFYLFTDDGKQMPEIVGKGIMKVNGHCTYLPDQNWILNDTYPDKDRLQKVYLFNVMKNRKVPLGDFFLPTAYTGEWRIDTHPRSSPDGSKVVVDCYNKSSGRQLFLMDIEGIIQ